MQDRQDITKHGNLYSNNLSLFVLFCSPTYSAPHGHSSSHLGVPLHLVHKKSMQTSVSKKICAR